MTLLVASSSSLKDSDMLWPMGGIRKTPNPIPSLEYAPLKNNFHTEFTSHGSSILSGGEPISIMTSGFMDRI